MMALVICCSPENFAWTRTSSPGRSRRIASSSRCQTWLNDSDRMSFSPRTRIAFSSFSLVRSSSSFSSPRPLIFAVSSSAIFLTSVNVGRLSAMYARIGSGSLASSLDFVKLSMIVPDRAEKYYIASSTLVVTPL